MAVELKSTFTPDRNLVTELPGGQAPAPYPSLTPALMQLILARQRPAPAAPRMAAPESVPQRMPTMGAQQSAPPPSDPNKRKYLTRSVIDPYSTPYDGMQNGFGLQRIGGPKMVQERYIPGDGWEFDKVDPRRAGSGGRGSIDVGSDDSERTRPTSNLQQRMPAYANGNPSNGYDANDVDPRTNLPRMPRRGAA